ncbi:hypothetical protein QJQ45_029749, partial [Haematococcus lacustris]
QGCDKTSSADEKTTSVVYDVFSSQPPVFRLSIRLSSADAVDDAHCATSATNFGRHAPIVALNSASSSKRPFFHSQFGPTTDGKRQCLCVVESPAFQAFVAALNPSSVLPSRSSACLHNIFDLMMLQMSDHMLLEEYAVVKAGVTSRLAAVPFVAITVDGWSQKQCLAWCVAGSQETFMLDCVHTEADSVIAVYIAIGGIGGIGGIARWRYGDNQVLYLAAILDPRYKIPKPQPEAEWQQFGQWMQHMPAEA